MHRLGYRVVFLVCIIRLGDTSWGASLGERLLLELDGLSEEQRLSYREVADQLRCPTCNGVSVLQSDAPFSQQIKLIVGQKVRQGESQETIVDYFTDRYGYWIRREPPMEGMHMMAWIPPIAMLILGPFFIWFFFWRRRRSLPHVPVRSAEDILAEMDTRLAELRRAAQT